MEGLSSAPLMISPHVERPCVRKATRWQPWSLRITYIGSLLDPAVIQRGNAVSWICLDHGGFEIDSSRRRDPLHAMGSFHASQSVGLARDQTSTSGSGRTPYICGDFYFSPIRMDDAFVGVAVKNVPANPRSLLLN